MPDYIVTVPAFRDLDEIRVYLEREASVETADHVESKLFAAFDELARLTPMGYVRNDVRQKPLRFHNVFRYIIAFRREPELVIVRVVHGARNLQRVFGSRKARSS